MDYAPHSELPKDEIAIVVTASRLPETPETSAPSVAIVDVQRVERLGEPGIAAYLRLMPSTSVATSGPAGSFTQVRIRGAEANHSLLFIDGIRANDPASGNEPRFELLGADIASRIELVRGPQSALWGSEAVGGVVAVDGDPAAGSGASGEVEAGSFGFRRAAGSLRLGGEMAGMALAIARSQADGIDSFGGGGGGDRDGFANIVARGLARLSPAPKLELLGSGLWLSGRSEFDGFDPLTFRRADTADQSRNRLTAGRIAATYGEAQDRWHATLSASLLGSLNRNFLDRDELNETRGRRATVEGQVARRFSTGRVDHALVVAASLEQERFEAGDTAFGGYSEQKKSRTHRAVTAEWRGSLADRLIADIALRRDMFNRFSDSTTLRASLLARVAPTLSVAASYGEGIAQPTFFDLYGFFPGSFVGNPTLRPERSRGFEASLRYRKAGLAASLTGYCQRLEDEIVDVFDPATFLSSAINTAGRSRRRGIEAEASWQMGQVLRVSANYAWLDASEPSVVSGQSRELRRPRHSGSLAVDGAHGRLSYGASIAYVGRRADIDFDLFQRVSLSPYWLGGARIAFEPRPGVRLFARLSNAFDDRYQDVIGYRAEGRSAHVGLRLAVGR